MAELSVLEALALLDRAEPILQAVSGLRVALQATARLGQETEAVSQALQSRQAEVATVEAELARRLAGMERTLAAARIETDRKLQVMQGECDRLAARREELQADLHARREDLDRLIRGHQRRLAEAEEAATAKRQAAEAEGLARLAAVDRAIRAKQEELAEAERRGAALTQVEADLRERMRTAVGGA